MRELWRAVLQVPSGEAVNMDPLFEGEKVRILSSPPNSEIAVDEGTPPIVTDTFGVLYSEKVPFQRRVALYARVSKEEGDKSDERYQEPENQLEPLREWAKSRGYIVYKEYVDRGSGADPNRDKFNEMIHDSLTSKFSKILVWKLDRFSRERMSVVVGRIERLKERGIALMSLTESWLDTSKENPVSDVILAIMTWAASEERRKISDRTKAGIAKRRAIGQWKGGRPKKRDPPSTTEEKS